MAERLSTLLLIVTIILALRGFQLVMGSSGEHDTIITGFALMGLSALTLLGNLFVNWRIKKKARETHASSNSSES